MDKHSRKLGLALLSALLSTQAALADTTITTTISGADTGKEAVSVAFAGNEATVTFADATTVTADMSLVSILLGQGNTPSAIGLVKAGGEATLRVFTLDGKPLGAKSPQELRQLAKGVYVVNGKKMTIK